MGGEKMTGEERNSQILIYQIGSEPDDTVYPGHICLMYVQGWMEG